ncbi:Uncharacterised protein [Mycobacterium tuberculosis]|nr:Uncharacterised protein [Mycobacterium tuberculosis]
MQLNRANAASVALAAFTRPIPVIATITFRPPIDPR